MISKYRIKMEQKYIIIIIILVVIILMLLKKNNVKEKFQNEMEVEVADRLKLLKFDKRRIKSDDGRYERTFYKYDLNQLQKLFPDTVYEDNKGQLQVHYGNLMNYVVRGLVENTVMYDLELKYRKVFVKSRGLLLKKISRLEKELENYKRMTNNT
jgi:hypothetical protein